MDFFDTAAWLIPLALVIIGLMEVIAEYEIRRTTQDDSNTEEKTSAHTRLIRVLTWAFVGSVLMMFVEWNQQARHETELAKIRERIESESIETYKVQAAAEWPYGNDRDRRRLILLLQEMERQSVWILRSPGDTQDETRLISDDAWALMEVFSEGGWGASGPSPWSGEPFSEIRIFANDPAKYRGLHEAMRKCGFDDLPPIERPEKGLMTRVDISSKPIRFALKDFKGELREWTSDRPVIIVGMNKNTAKVADRPQPK